MSNSNRTHSSATARPAIWEHITLKLLEIEDEVAPVRRLRADVYALTCVEPLPEYGLRPDDGPPEWTMVADCLYAIGHQALHVLEIWSTREGAATACRRFLKEQPEHLAWALMVVPYRVHCLATVGDEAR